MNVTLISPSPHVNKIHAYGVRLLSACLKRAGHQVDIIFLPRVLGEFYPPRVIDQIVELTAHAGLIGVSLMTDDYENAIRITAALKRASRTPVLWGGIHPTLLPHDCLKHADMVCIGEGEDAIVELADRMSRGEDYRQVAGVWFRDGDRATMNPLRPLIQDLDRLPYPDYDPARHYVLYDGEIRPMSAELIELCLKEYYLTLTTRGCPSHCTYCWNHAYNRIFAESHRIRKRSVDNVIGELKAITARFPFIELICVDDDAFFMRTNEDIEEFGAKYKEQVKIPMWVTGAAPLTITPRKLDALTAAGLTAVRMGIQSGSARTKKLYQRQHSNRSVLNAARLLDRYRDKIKRRQFDIILDNPWETDADLRQTLMLLSHFPLPYELIIFPLMFYPGTDLEKKARGEGLITIDGTVPDRIRRHQFKMSFLNRLFMLLDQCARNGVRIGSAEMRLITSPSLRRLGVSEWWLGRIRRRLAQASYCVPAEGKSYIDFCEDSFAPQLGAGWYDWEKTEGGGFRWTAKKCTFYLFPNGTGECLRVEGSIPQFEHYGRRQLKIKICEGKQVILRDALAGSGGFELNASLAAREDSAAGPRVFHLQLDTAFTPSELGLGPDIRQLGLVVRTARLV